MTREDPLGRRSVGKFTTLILITIVFGVWGCSLVPRYERPTAPIPPQWPKGSAYDQRFLAEAPPVSEDRQGEKIFLDEKLKKIIDIALKGNRDFKISALQVERARAYYGIQKAELFPVVNAVGAGSKQRVPADLSYTGKETTTEQYSVNLGVSSWELDFFGRIRSLKDRTLEEYLATEQAIQSARILLVATVAGAYFTLAADRENLRLAVSTVETQETMYRLIKRRYEVGLSSELDLRRAEGQLEAARAEAARYTQQTALDENALRLLVGSELTDDLLPSGLEGDEPVGEVSPGLSSEILLQRPDIRAAEHRLKASHANIGAARAALFPRVALTAAFGTASAELNGLFKSGSSTWNFAPQIVMPIFDARLWSAYDAAKVEREIALAQYEKAIQTAFKEVADTLAVRGTLETQLALQRTIVDVLTETHRLAHLRYAKGLDSYLSALDAQRSLYSARQGLVSLRLARLVNRIGLYKVLGGI